jgi:hypothetical protein
LSPTQNFRKTSYRYLIKPLSDSNIKSDAHFIENGKAVGDDRRREKKTQNK